MNLFNDSVLMVTHLFQDDYCEISISANNYCIYQCYHQLPPSKDFLIPSMERVLTMARQWSVNGGAVYYLVEVEKGGLLPTEDITWIKTDVIPQLGDAGIHYLAYVSPNNIFRRFGQDHILASSGADKSLSLRIFQNRDEALNWFSQTEKAK